MGTKTPSSPKARAAIGVKSFVAFSAMKTMDPNSERVQAALAVGNYIREPGLNV